MPDTFGNSHTYRSSIGCRIIPQVFKKTLCFLSAGIQHHAVFEMFMMKTEMRDEGVKEQLADFKKVIEAFTESMRTNTGILRDVRDKVSGGDGRGGVA